MKKQNYHGRNVYKIISIIVFVALMLVGSALLGPVVVQTVKEPEQFQTYINSFGIWSPLIFIGIQVLQVVFAIIPGELIELGAGYAFGAFYGLVLCLVGVAIASTIVFLIVRKLGNKAATILIGDNHMNKLKFLHDEKKLIMLLMILYFVPGTPKDLLTYFAGLTKIKTSHFLLISTFFRIPSIITSTLAGAALGDQNYMRSIVIFLISGAIAVIGILIFRKISNNSQKPAVSNSDE